MRTVDRSAPRERVERHRLAGTDVARVAYPIHARAVRVLRRDLVTPRMLRLTVGGPGLDGFCSHEADDHVKVVLPDETGEVRAPRPNDRQMLDWPRPMPPTREYTVRRIDIGARELDLDVVLHDGGLASAWLDSRLPGDDLVLAGPPGASVVPHTFDHYVLAVDATALPAAARWIETAPAGVAIDLVVEVLDGIELTYPVPAHHGLRQHRLVRGDGSAIGETVAGLELPEGRTFVFAAGEADDLRAVRSWVRGRHPASITGYWKRGHAHHDDG